MLSHMSACPLQYIHNVFQSYVPVIVTWTS